jgi:hypothetical protein
LQSGPLYQPFASIKITVAVTLALGPRIDLSRSSTPRGNVVLAPIRWTGPPNAIFLGVGRPPSPYPSGLTASRLAGARGHWRPGARVRRKPHRVQVTICSVIRAERPSAGCRACLRHAACTTGGPAPSSLRRGAVRASSGVQAEARDWHGAPCSNLLSLGTNAETFWQAPADVVLRSGLAQASSVPCPATALSSFPTVPRPPLWLVCDPCGRRGRFIVDQLKLQNGDARLEDNAHGLRLGGLAQHHDRCKARYDGL